jgi:hypothetical protein
MDGRWFELQQRSKLSLDHEFGKYVDNFPNKEELRERKDMELLNMSHTIPALSQITVLQRAWWKETSKDDVFSGPFQ